MILGTTEIRKRLDAGEIFQQGTWDANYIKEASYALRVAEDGMMLAGEMYDPDSRKCPDWPITIQPGRLAILSTVERLRMPGDLVGRLGIRLDFAAKGLTGLMGIQVDPHYGADDNGERLFIRVANFGNDDIKIDPGAPVFNIEFSKVKGADKPKKRKGSTWDRVRVGTVGQGRSDYSYVTRVQTDLNNRADDLENQLSEDVDGIRNNQQSVVMFGVFLVSITILGVMLGLLFNVEGAPNWVEEWGWKALFVLFFLAASVVIGFVGIAGYRFLRPYRADIPKKPRLKSRSGRHRPPTP